MLKKFVKIYIFGKSQAFTIVLMALTYVIPLFLAAQTTPRPGELTDRIRDIKGTLNDVIGILFVLATVVFLWGMIQYIRASADDAGRKKAQGIMVWGIIGLTVMTTAWGLVTILLNYFGVPAAAPGRIDAPVF